MYNYTKPNEKDHTWLIDTKIAYYYIVSDSPKRGHNVRVIVFRKRRNGMERIGYSDHNTASWTGAKGRAVRIASNVYGHKCTPYEFISPNIRAHELADTRI